MEPSRTIKSIVRLLFIVLPVVRAVLPPLGFYNAPLTTPSYLHRIFQSARELVIDDEHMQAHATLRETQLRLRGSLCRLFVLRSSGEYYHIVPPLGPSEEMPRRRDPLLEDASHPHRAHSDHTVIVEESDWLLIISLDVEGDPPSDLEVTVALYQEDLGKILLSLYYSGYDVLAQPIGLVPQPPSIHTNADGF